MYIKQLSDSGLSIHEAKIYYSLIKFGDATAAELSTRTSIGRTNIYDYTASLVKKGLINQFEKNQKTIFFAEDPKILQDIVNQKVREAKDASNSLFEIMQGLAELYNTNINRPIIKTFSGAQGYKTLFDKIYTTTHSKKIFILLPNLDNYSLPAPKYRNTILREQIFTYILVNSGSNINEFQRRDARELRKTILVPKSVLEIDQDYIFYNDQLVSGNISIENFFVTNLKSKSIIKLFETLLTHFTNTQN